jgi:hypothetical protein
MDNRPVKDKRAGRLLRVASCGLRETVYETRDAGYEMLDTRYWMLDIKMRGT